MNIVTGAGIGIVAGACAGKAFRPQIQREVDALRTDLAYERNTRTKDVIDFNDFMDHIESYPSVYRRVENGYYSIRRGIHAIQRIPARVTAFVQRGRRGWADEDAWNVDMHVVDTLEGILSYYRREMPGYPADTTEEEWNDRIDEILWGLRQYQLYWDNWHELGTEDYQEASTVALAALKHSFELLAEDLPGIWM